MLQQHPTIRRIHWRLWCQRQETTTDSIVLLPPLTLLRVSRSLLPPRKGYDYRQPTCTAWSRPVQLSRRVPHISLADESLTNPIDLYAWSHEKTRGVKHGAETRWRVGANMDVRVMLLCTGFSALLWRNIGSSSEHPPSSSAPDLTATQH